jgi:hypothetical protein
MPKHDFWQERDNSDDMSRKKLMPKLLLKILAFLLWSVIKVSLYVKGPYRGEMYIRVAYELEVVTKLDSRI